MQTEEFQTLQQCDGLLRTVDGAKLAVPPPATDFGETLRMSEQLLTFARLVSRVLSTQHIAYSSPGFRAITETVVNSRNTS